MTMHVTTDKVHAAVLDEAHVGHIRGALERDEIWQNREIPFCGVM